MKKTLTMVFAAVVLAGCQSTQTANLKSAEALTSEEPVTEVAKADGSNVYTCRIEKIVGSKLPQRVCISKADADTMRDAAREQMRKFEENAGRAGSN